MRDHPRSTNGTAAFDFDNSNCQQLISAPENDLRTHIERFEHQKVSLSTKSRLVVFNILQIFALELFFCY